MPLFNAATNVAEVAERRRAERFETQCNALIRLSQNLTFPCRVRNLSMDAAQVACDPRYALLVHPPESNRLRLLELSMALNVNGSVRGVTAQGIALYRVEPSLNSGVNDEMLLGVRFSALDAGAKQLLAAYLGSLIFA